MIFPCNDKQIYYRTNGNGPALVLLHGFLEDLSMWDPLIDLLGEKFTVIRIDLPGHGKSDVFREIHTMEFMADVVQMLVEEKGIGTITIMGHSMGGYVALAYLEKYAKNVRQFILLNSTPYADTEERKRNRERALSLIPENKETFINVSIRNLFAENTRQNFAGKIGKLQKEANNIPTPGILAALRGMKDRKDRSEVLKAYEGNKILICGDKDSVVPIEDSARAASYTNSKLISVSSGHMTLVENVNEIIKIMHFIE
jgi:pimeloyl-ACP methyl ester carboxylesterase